jgi:P4 family phage/plasmid primase-like protien
MKDEPENIIPAMAQFAKLHGLVTPLEKAATEEALCEYLREKIGELFGPVRCHGKEWLIYDEGIWRIVEPDLFGNLILDVMHPDVRSAHRADNLEAFLGRRLRAEAPVEYHSCYKFGPAGSVLVNCANGVLSVSKEKVEILAHAPEHNFRAKIVTAYQAEAECPVFEQAIQDAMPDGEDIALFRLFSGYLLYPSCRYNTCLVLYGESTTGKSRVAEAVSNVLGDELTCYLSLHEMCNDTHKHSLPELEHKLLNLSTEVDAAEIGSSDIFKSLISGEPRMVARKYGHPFKMATQCKHWFLSNHPPYFKHATDAEMNRVRIIHFPARVKEVDVHFADKLRGETQGIFRFMIDGLRELLGKKVIPQGGSRSQTRASDNAERLDPVKHFFEQCCDVDPDSYETKDAIFDAFQQWRDDHDVPPMYRDWFFRNLKTRFGLTYKRFRDVGRRYCVAGIRLKAVWE